MYAVKTILQPLIFCLVAKESDA